LRRKDWEDEDVHLGCRLGSKVLPLRNGRRFEASLPKLEFSKTKTELEFSQTKTELGFARSQAYDFKIDNCNGSVFLIIMQIF
jgi:hypothetical protein